MRKIIFSILIAVLAVGVTGCGEDYRLYWAVGTSAKQTRGEGAWVERSTYYAIAPVGGMINPAFIKLAASDGTEPTSNVVWTLSNPTIGSFDVGMGYPPSRRAIHPAAAGEGIVSAEYDGKIDSSKLIVFPSTVISKTQGVDLDNDGIVDAIVTADTTGVSCPFGVQHYLPYPFSEGFVSDANALGDIPADIDWPADNPTVFNTDGVRIILFKTSTGALYAAQISKWVDRFTFGWRKVRDAA